MNLKMNLPSISSLIVCAETGKRHDHILRVIKKISSWGYAHLFTESSYKDPSGRRNKCFYIGRDGFLFICMTLRGTLFSALTMAFIKTVGETVDSLTGGEDLHEVQLDNGDTVKAVDSLKEAFLAWGFAGTPMMDALNLDNKEQVKQRVYVFKMNNNTVKIGVAKNIKNRMAQVTTSSGAEIIKEYHTELLPKKTALQIEKELHSTFDSFRLKGEFFSVDFDDAEKLLKKCILMIA